MALSYQNILDRTEETLQDSANATYSTAELGTIIEDEIKRISRYKPLLVDVIFKIESRRGTDATGTASKLTDSVKAQFLAADATNEKVVHNVTDDTWAVVTAQDSTSILSLSRNIMAANENYEIYNKRCKNARQIYIGDMPPYLWVHSVEYPIGTERNFKVLDDVIELEVDDTAIEDSDSTLTTLASVDVLVKFAFPHILCQLTDLAGEIDLVAGYAAGDTSIVVDGLGNTEIIEVGEQFNLENHRFTYIVTTQVTTSANEATIVIYPGLEAAATDNDDVTFKKSTLTPDLEEILCQRVAARAMLSNTVTKLDTMTIGGGYRNERQWAYDTLAETERELKGDVKAKPYKRLARV